MAEVDRKIAEAPFVLALDIGTSSTRAMLFDRLGRMIKGTLSRCANAMHTDPAGTAIMDADRLRGSICDCIDSSLAKSGALSTQIGAVGSCTFVSNVLGVDPKGQAITPLFLYADARPSEDAHQLKELCDEETIHQRTGCHFHASYLPARFLWIAHAHPEWIHERVRWMSIGEYLLLELFGETAASLSVASWSGLLNRESVEWDGELLELLPISPSQLSPLVDLDFRWRDLRNDYARRWPALREVPWFPAVGDGAASNVGSGCISSQRMALALGTSSALRVLSAGSFEHIPQGLWCYRLDRQHELLGGALNEGGGVIDWLKRTLNLPQAFDVEQCLASPPAHAHGLTFLPLLAGERSPGWIGSARGILAGLSLATTPQDILRAGVEGIAYRMALIYQRLSPMLTVETEIIASGAMLQGASRLAQTIADALGRPLILSSLQEPSGRGVAMLALRSLGISPDLNSFPTEIGMKLDPDMERHAYHRAEMQRQMDLYHQWIIHHVSPGGKNA